jgi:hypothetical protein
MPNRVSLSESIKKIHQFFIERCGGQPLTYFNLISANEDLAKGVYVIRCSENCFMEQPRKHEIWIDLETGDICHTHRISDEK